jgi:hypothetical protein
MKNLSRKLGIIIGELPSRPNKISPEEYEKVFGGACFQGDACDCDNQCCDNYTCRGFIIGGTKKYYCLKV